MIEPVKRRRALVAFKRGWKHGASELDKKDGPFRGDVIVHTAYVEGYSRGVEDRHQMYKDAEEDLEGIIRY